MFYLEFLVVYVAYLFRVSNLSMGTKNKVLIFCYYFPNICYVIYSHYIT